MKVLHVPFTYEPDPIGGTEVYVKSLCRELKLCGADALVAAPARRAETTTVDGINVFRFPIGPKSEQGEGTPDVVAASTFNEILEVARPDVVHLHARTSAVSHLLLHAARRFGARTVFTYHTPTVSCARGTMLFMGHQPCDGVLLDYRCTACVLKKHVPLPAARALACVPRKVGHALARAGLQRGPWLAWRMSQIVADGHTNFHKMMEAADRVVAVCEWVAEVLRRNGVIEPKLLVSRQGLAAGAEWVRKSASHVTTGALKLAYFGRLDHNKGVHVVIQALQQLPDAAVQLNVYGVMQDDARHYLKDLIKYAAGDPRIVFHHAVPPERVPERMRDAHVIVVPSIWLETGPLVVLEAFSARTPVIGSHLGGISELVRDGVDGILVPPDQPSAWAKVIGQLAASPEKVRAMRESIQQPRSMREVAQEMMNLYLCL